MLGIRAYWTPLYSNSRPTYTASYQALLHTRLQAILHIHCWVTDPARHPFPLMPHIYYSVSFLHKLLALAITRYSPFQDTPSPPHTAGYWALQNTTSLWPSTYSAMYPFQLDIHSFSHKVLGIRPYWIIFAKSLNIHCNFHAQLNTLLSMLHVNFYVSGFAGYHGPQSSAPHILLVWHGRCHPPSQRSPT